MLTFDTERKGPMTVELFDTTLRDGAQREGVSLSVTDKLRIAKQLDHLGVAFIEGGWPGANPKDDEFFRRALSGELDLPTSVLVAFGATRRANGYAETDETLARLLAAGTEVVCMVAKSSAYHVTETLCTSLDEGVRMVEDSVRFLAAQRRRVFVDCEHFFDGWKDDPVYAARVLEACGRAGAEVLVLCDTNGGTLPHEASSIVAAVVELVDDLDLDLSDGRPRPRVGVHFHNDCDMAVANSIEAVRYGATHVQGCINGYGERTGNANLTSIIADLELRLGISALPQGRLERLTSVANHVAELVNVAPNPQAPFVGASAFAHKAGLHASAIARAPRAYEHVDPAAVGNGSRLVVSELAGRSTLAMKAASLGVNLSSDALSRVLEDLKQLEHRGYHFEAADASLELFLRSEAGWKQPWFSVESYRMTTESRDSGMVVEATLKVLVGDERVITVAEGNGPVNTLDAALRKAISGAYPQVARIHLTDYRVRVLDSGTGSSAATRVLVDSTDDAQTWSTIGVSDNVIEASWLALVDSIVYGLLTMAPDESLASVS